MPAMLVSDDEKNRSPDDTTRSRLDRRNDARERRLGKVGFEDGLRAAPPRAGGGGGRDSFRSRRDASAGDCRVIVRILSCWRALSARA